MRSERNQSNEDAEIASQVGKVAVIVINLNAWQQDDRLNKFSRWLRELELQAWKSLFNAGHGVDDVLTYIAIDGIADLDQEESDRSELGIWMKESQIGAKALSRPGEHGSAADAVQVLLTAVNAIQGPVIYVYMSDTPQGEAHPFWREINSQPKVAAAHYMAYDVDNRDHYAAQPEKYFWVKDGIRSDRLQVTQSEEGGAQDPVIFSTGEHASRRDLSHSVSQTLDRSSSQDEQTVEAELDRVETETSTRPSIEDGHSSSQRQDTVEAALDAVQLSAEHIEDVSQQIHQPARSVTAELNDSADLAGALASLVVNSTSSGEPAVSHRETGLGSSMSDRLSNLIRRSQRPAYTVEFDPQVHHYPLPDSFRAAEIRWIYKVYPNGTRSDAFFFNNIVLKYRNQSDVRLTQGWSDNRVYLEDFVTIGIPLRVYEKLLTKLRALFSREGVDPKLPDTDGESHYAWLDVKLRRDARYQFFVPDSSGRTLGPLRYLAERTHRLETKHLVGRGQLALRVNHVPGLSPRLGGTLWGFDHASCVDIGSGSILR